MSHDDPATDPADLVARYLRKLTPGQRVLDVACGAGRHARLALALGLHATLLDRDLSRVTDLACRDDVVALEADLEDGRPWPLEVPPFDAVVVTNYLYRPLFPRLRSALAPRGLLLYETFGQGNERFGKPSNPNFLLAPGELLAAFADLEILESFHGEVDTPRPAIVSRLAARVP